MRFALLVCLLAAMVGAPKAAAQGGTDIYLASLTIADDGVTIGTPVNVTHRAGYDNQPFFSPSGSSFYFTSIRDGQADVYRYDLETRSVTQIIATPESEYSPTVVPGTTTLAVVRVEADSTQRLWGFTLEGLRPHLLVADVAPVGYQGWDGDRRVALFVLGSPATMQIADLASGESRTVAENIGRTITPAPDGRAMGYVQHRDDTPWFALLDLTTLDTEPVVALPGPEFFAWLPDGSVLAARGTTLLRYRAGGDREWEQVADFASIGLSAITRLAVAPDGSWIAIVSTDPE